jgi:phosphatidate cytidylyltransferase
MKRVLTAVVLIPIVLLLTFKAPLWLFCLVVAVVAMLAMREYMDLVVAYGYEPLRTATYLMVPLYFAILATLAVSVHHHDAFFDVVLFAGALAFPFALAYSLLGLRRELKRALPSIGLTWAGFTYIPCTLATLIMLRILPLGPFYLLYLFLVVWAGDAFAYWIGKSIGRHQLAPEVSPNKTWEGAVASIVSAGVLGTLLLHYSSAIVPWMNRSGATLMLGWNEGYFFKSGLAPFPPAVYSIPILRAFLCSALINVAAQLGDLVESMMKRGAGVKDSGSILPGHGGMLDRVDALLFAAPVGFVIILFAIHS